MSCHFPALGAFRRWLMVRRPRARLFCAFVALVALTTGVVPARGETTLRVVMHSDLKIVDPIWTTAYIVRNHGYMIYDTLFAGELDYLESPPHDLYPVLKADSNVRLVTLNPLGNQYTFRYNTLHKPF